MDAHPTATLDLRPTLDPQASIVVTRHREPTPLLQDALRSLLAQRGGPFEILVLDQQDDPALRAWLAAQPSAHAVRAWTIPPAGLSAARNAGLLRARTDRVLFVDPVAIADPGWAQALAAALAEPDVVEAGGKILPRFEGPRPGWASSRIVQEQWSLLDLGDADRDVEKVIGCSFALHRERWETSGPFDIGHGRRDGNLQGGEETELCRRVRAAGRRLRYVGNARVFHRIAPERLSLRWIQRRLWWAGFSRARQFATSSLDR